MKIKNKVILYIIISFPIYLIFLCLPASLLAFKHLGLYSSIFILLTISLFALFGPFASLFYQIPLFTFFIFDIIHLILIVLIITINILLYFKHKDKKLFFMHLFILIWIIFGSYYSSIGVLSSV